MTLDSKGNATQQISLVGSGIRTKRTKTIASVAVAAVVVIIVAVAGAVLGTRKTSYSDYDQLANSLQDTYSATNFFDDFDFFRCGRSDERLRSLPIERRGYTMAQPTHNLTCASESSAMVRVNTSTGEYDTSAGWWSIRISSKKQYDSGLFIFNVLHSPVGCGTWPALWLSDPNDWPDNDQSIESKVW
jgi:hypothetical protein